MTVSTTTSKVSYSGNGSTTVFAYTFKIFDEDDLTVILRDDTTGTETVQAITTNYTVSGVGNAGGGNVTFVTAPASGKTVVIRRESAQTQTTDYTPNDPFPAEAHEDALDKLTFIAQEVQEELDRAIKISRTNTMTSTEFTVGATARANKILAFDSSGEIAVTQEIGTFVGNWSASTAYNQRDIVKDTSTNNIFIANTAHTSSGSQPLTTNTDSAKWDLLVDAASATTSATAAAASATAAATSATNSANSATAAATSATNAATSETNAATSETNAATSESNASTSETNAATSATSAATSATTATTQATAASTSATNAATSATNAATSETNAATSETNAATSATTATTQATAASTSATNAATSATTATTQASNASASATAAAASAAAAAASADTFDDTYLGAKSSDPTVDNDGDPLNAGDLYFNTTSNTLKVYNGSAWNDAALASADFVQITGDTMTGNLGVQGTITVGDSHTIGDDADDNLELASSASENIVIDSAGGTTAFKENGTEVARLTGGSLGIGTTSPSASHKLTLDHTSNYGGISLKQTGTQVGQIIQEGGTGNIYFDADSASVGGNLILRTNGGTEAMRINSSGNVGIGTTSPSNTLQATISAPASVPSAGASGHAFAAGSASYGVVAGALTSGNSYIQVTRWDGTASNYGLLLNPNGGNVGIGTTSPSQKLTVDGAGTAARIEVRNTSDSNRGGYLRDTGSAFEIGTNSGVRPLAFAYDGSEAMRIDTARRLLVDRTSAYSEASIGTPQFQVNGVVGSRAAAAFIANTSGSLNIVGFANSNGTVGSINVSGSSTTYNTSSDYRLKENVTDITGATERLKQLNPVRFNFIADADTTVDGFLAHEVQDVVPEAITGTKDAVDDDGNPVYQGIDQSKLVPLLVATIQELEARIAALEAN